MGSVIQAGIGQAPARQVGFGAGRAINGNLFHRLASNYRSDHSEQGVCKRNEGYNHGYASSADRYSKRNGCRRHGIHVQRSVMISIADI